LQFDISDFDKKRCARSRSYPLKRTKAKKKPDSPLSYSSSLVIYTSSRRDDTTTEDSDAAFDVRRQNPVLKTKLCSRTGNARPKLARLSKIRKMFQ
jgi:ankyrin repeat protein